MSLRDAFLDYRGYNIVLRGVRVRTERGRDRFRDWRDDRVRAESTMTIAQCTHWHAWLFDTSVASANRFTLEAIAVWYPRCPEKFDVDA